MQLLRLLVLPGYVLTLYVTYEHWQIHGNLFSNNNITHSNLYTAL